MTFPPIPHQDNISRQRDAMHAELASAVEDYDPLAAYDTYVTWILQNYVNHSDSGLLEFLEETVRNFRDDVRCSPRDPRYVKFWILFANLVENPTTVYAYMFEQGIGTSYALFFQEYAMTLERQARFTDAETVITLGIRTQAQPPKHLQSFQNDFNARRATGKPLSVNPPPFGEDMSSPAVHIIRTDPLQKIAPGRAGSTGPSTLSGPSNAQHDFSMHMTAIDAVETTRPTRPNPYAHLNAPVAPGKRPEKLKFDLTLLLHPDGTEYSFEEARARHLGLLGKKWPAPPAPNAAVALPGPVPRNDTEVQERSVKVDFNDQGTKMARVTRRQSVTVTINTKQALDDVFDMYNYPTKEDAIPEAGAAKLWSIPGSPHTGSPAPSRRPPVIQDENAGVNPRRAFQPSVGQRQESATPAPLKFKPSTTRTTGVNAFTSNGARKAFGEKNSVAPVPAAPVPAFKVNRPDQNATSIVASEPRPLTEYPEDKSGINEFDGADVTADEFTDEFTNATPSSKPPPPFVPFLDDDRQHFAMSGRFGDFDVMTPIAERTCEFTVRVADTPGSDRSSMCDKGFVVLDAQDAAEKLAAELQEEENRDREVAAVTHGEPLFQGPFLRPELLHIRGVDDIESESAFSSFDDRSNRTPFRLSDGFTIEPNHSTILSSTISVDKSTTANLGDVFATQSGFEAPNPCNPSDPAILSALFPFLPSDPNHRDFQRVANKLNKLQRFAANRATRGSGASSSGQDSDGSDGFILELDEDQFKVYGKLGEGGFGAVFMAKDMNRDHGQLNEDDDEDDEDDADDGLVAVKVVRPTNLWESYMLRQVASAVPEDLRRSIIRPHSLYAFQDESFLVLELCQQGTLLEIVNRAGQTGVGQPGGGVDELLVMFFVVELLRIIQGLHGRGFIHGDLKIDNCLIRLEDVPGGSSAWSSEYNPAGEGGWAHKGIKLIDFGRTIDTNLFPPGQTFVADWKTDSRDCVEMREGRPWTFQTDYSGLASIAYCMLFGKYIETVAVTRPDGTQILKPNQPMKRYWQTDLWSRFFEILLNSCQVRPDGFLPITNEIAALRRDLEMWLKANCNKAGKNLKGMLKRIETAALGRSPRGNTRG